MSDTGLRKKVFIDSRVQGALLRQLVWHWCLACFIMVAYLLILQAFLSGLEGNLADHVQAVWNRYAPLAVVLITLFPVFLYDSIRLSHRFAGPMVNLKRNLRKLAEGEPIPPLRFRQGDFWQELTSDFNLVADRLSKTVTGQSRQEA